MSVVWAELAHRKQGAGLSAVPCGIPCRDGPFQVHGAGMSHFLICAAQTWRSGGTDPTGCSWLELELVLAPGWGPSLPGVCCPRAPTVLEDLAGRPEIIIHEVAR